MPRPYISAIVSARIEDEMTPLVVDNVSKAYKQGDRSVQALAGVSLSVARGQFLAVMGASGSGKSTLLHLVAGLTAPDSGRILINDTDISTMRPATCALPNRTTNARPPLAGSVLCMIARRLLI